MNVEIWHYLQFQSVIILAQSDVLTSQGRVLIFVLMVPPPTLHDLLDIHVTEILLTCH